MNVDVDMQLWGFCQSCTNESYTEVHRDEYDEDASLFCSVDIIVVELSVTSTTTWTVSFKKWNSGVHTIPIASPVMVQFPQVELSTP